MSSAEEAAAPGWRAKLYQLNDRGDWDDRGTGMVCCVYSESLRGPVVAVTAEETGIVLLESQVSAESVYQRQGDTIVTWNDCRFGLDLALSFEDVGGCKEIYERILTLHDTVGSTDESRDDGEGEDEGLGVGGGEEEKERTGMDDGMNRVRESDGADVVDMSYEWSGGGSGGEASDRGSLLGEEVALPALERANLAAIAQAVAEVEPVLRTRMAVEIVKRGTSFFERLLSIFDDADDLEDEAAIAEIFKILKGVAVLNHSGLYDLILSDRFFARVVGVLEHDPDVVPALRVQHRAFVEGRATFKEVVPIRNPLVVASIHQNFRIQYLKDCVLQRAIDASGQQSLKMLLRENNTRIVSELSADPEYFSDVLTVVRRGVEAHAGAEGWSAGGVYASEGEGDGEEGDTEHASGASESTPSLECSPTTTSAAADSDGGSNADERAAARERGMSDAVLLLQELCSLARDLDIDTRSEFYRSLCEIARARSNWEDRDSSSVSFFQVIDRGLFHRGEAGSAAAGHGARRCALSTKNRTGMVNLLTHTILSDQTLLRRFVTESARVASAQRSAGRGGAECSASDGGGGVPAVRAAGAGMWACRSAVAAGGSGVSRTAKSEEKGVPSPIFANLISLIVDEDDAGVQAHVVQILHILLDPDLMSDAQKETVLTNFYNHGIKQLLIPLYALNENGDGRGVSASAKRAQNYIVELLSFCVQFHGYRIKYTLLRENVIDNVLKLICFREKHMVLTAIRFIRTCIELKDPFYNRYIVKHKLMAPIFAAFKRNGPRNNLINSVVLDMCTWIRAENVTLLINHIVTEYSAMFEGVSYVETFKELSLASSMGAEDCGGAGGAGDGIPVRSGSPGRSSMDAQEQAYFESDVDDVLNASEPTAAPAASVALLAKYSDDDASDDSSEGGDDSAAVSPVADAGLGAGGPSEALAAATTTTSTDDDARSAKHPRSPDSPELQPPKRARVDDALTASALGGSGGAAPPVKLTVRHRARAKRAPIVIKLAAATTAAANTKVGAGTHAAMGGLATSKESSLGSSGGDGAEDDGGGGEGGPLQKRARIEPAP